MIALSFFDQFPPSVSGMVMVDGSEPDLWFRGSPDEFSSMRMMDPIWQGSLHESAFDVRQAGTDHKHRVRSIGLTLRSVPLS